MVHVWRDKWPAVSGPQADRPEWTTLRISEMHLRVSSWRLIDISAWPTRVQNPKKSLLEIGHILPQSMCSLAHRNSKMHLRVSSWRRMDISAWPTRVQILKNYLLKIGHILPQSLYSLAHRKSKMYLRVSSWRLIDISAWPTRGSARKRSFSSASGL